MGLKIQRHAKYPGSHVPTSILTPRFHPRHSAITLFHIYIHSVVSGSHCKGGRGTVNLTDEDSEVSTEYHTGHRAPPSRKLYSLFTEAAKLAQDSVDDAVLVIPQVCLQHSGQCVLLHPHLNPRAEGQGSTQVHFIHHCFVGSYLLFLIF